MQRNKKMARSCEIIRAIVKELSGQVQWGLIGKDKELTENFQTAYYRHWSRASLVCQICKRLFSSRCI